jgi:hypothetical protein
MYLLVICCKDTSKAIVAEGSVAGNITLKPCVFETMSEGRYNADCGNLIVQEGRDKSDSRLIALPVIRVHAVDSESAEPVFYLAGGPGQTNMDFKPPDELLVNHDFILIGYRGANGSVKLDCPEVNRAIKGVGADLLSTPSLSGLSTAFRQCADRHFANHSCFTASSLYPSWA